MDERGVFTVPHNIPKQDVVCSVVGLGNSLKEAEEQCLEICKQIYTDFIFYNKNAFLEGEESIKSGLKYGIDVF